MPSMNDTPSLLGATGYAGASSSTSRMGENQAEGVWRHTTWTDRLRELDAIEKFGGKLQQRAYK